jgi:hypothetical protein
MHGTCGDVGLPHDPGKDEGPATRLAFTGIEVDSVAMMLRLPPAKLMRSKAELIKWRNRKG